jgi:hypothetical protein
VRAPITTTTPLHLLSLSPPTFCNLKKRYSFPPSFARPWRFPCAHTLNSGFQVAVLLNNAAVAIKGDSFDGVGLIKPVKGEIEQNRAFDHCGQRAIQRWRDRNQDGCVVEVCAVRCLCIRVTREIHPLRLGFLCRLDTRLDSWKTVMDVNLFGYVTAFCGSCHSNQ